MEWTGKPFDLRSSLFALLPGRRRGGKCFTSLSIARLTCWPEAFDWTLFIPGVPGHRPLVKHPFGGELKIDRGLGQGPLSSTIWSLESANLQYITSRSSNLGSSGATATFYSQLIQIHIRIHEMKSTQSKANQIKFAAVLRTPCRGLIPIAHPVSSPSLWFDRGRSGASWPVAGMPGPMSARAHVNHVSNPFQHHAVDFSAPIALANAVQPDDMTADCGSGHDTDKRALYGPQHHEETRIPSSCQCNSGVPNRASSVVSSV